MENYLFQITRCVLEKTFDVVLMVIKNKKNGHAFLFLSLTYERLSESIYYKKNVSLNLERRGTKKTVQVRFSSTARHQSASNKQEIL